MPKPELHQSSLAMLYRCPKQYEFRYVQGIIRPPAVALLIGTGVHVGAQADLISKLSTGALLPADAVLDAARLGLLAAWERGVTLEPEEQEQGESYVRGEAIDTVVALAGLHHEHLAPTIVPTHVERKWRLELQGYPYDVAGTIDVQEEGTVRDLKTAAKSPPANAADESLQLTTYAVAVKFTDGRLPKRLYLDHLIKTKEPKIVTLASKRTQRQVDCFLRRLDVAMRQLEAGVFPPCDPSMWWCSKRFCGYWKECPYV